MLVVSRKCSERVFVGDDIVITIVDVDRGKVRVGIEAPRGVSIYREEIAPAGHPLKPEPAFAPRSPR